MNMRKYFLLWCDNGLCTFQSMQILKKSELKPYFIFIAPGGIANLKQMRQQQGVSVTVRTVLFLVFIIAQLYASSVCAVVVCPSVCHTHVLYQNG